MMEIRTFSENETENLEKIRQACLARYDYSIKGFGNRQDR